jgi:hypothetical protein
MEKPGRVEGGCAEKSIEQLLELLLLRGDHAHFHHQPFAKCLFYLSIAQLDCFMIDIQESVSLNIKWCNLHLVVEGNLNLTMFGNTYLLSKILLLALNNIMQIMILWLRIR